MLVVLDRSNLETVFIQHYDTNIYNRSLESTPFTNITTYSFNEATGEVQAEAAQTKTHLSDPKYKPAAELSEKIK